MTVKLGVDQNGKPVRLDIDVLVKSRMLIQANSGGGKSWAVRRLLEQTHGKIQQIVIDPEGEFYTLRNKFDYVLCGKGGDCPAEPRSAALLARRLLELGCSAVLDIYELDPPDRVKFVRLFLESLIDAPRKLWHPALIIIDEAHYFAPQKGDAESYAAVAALMSKGRKRGFCGIPVTQRLAKLHKDIAAEANNILIGRTRLDVDRRRAGDDLGFTPNEARLKLQPLKPGEFFAFGPAFMHDDVLRMKFGRVKTPHPEAGARAAPPAPPRAKVKALLSELADLPAAAEEEARTVGELQVKLREIERENRKLKTGHTIDPETLDRAREEGAAAIRGQFARQIQHVEDARDEHRGLIEAANRGLKQLEVELGKPFDFDLGASVTKIDIDANPVLRLFRKDPSPLKFPRQNVATHEGIDTPMQRILDAVGWLESTGLEPPYSRIQIAFLAKYKPNAGGFNNPLGRLKTLKLVTYPVVGKIAFTPDGRSIANTTEKSLTPADLHERIRERIDSPMWRILEPLIKRYPNTIAKEDLAELAGYKFGAGGFNNPLGRLRTLGLIVYPSSGYAVALPVLFP